MTERIVYMSGWRKKEEYDPYDPKKAERGEYSPRELDYYANQLLREAASEIDPETGKAAGLKGILLPEHEYARKRREIYTEGGTPDPSLVQGLYNRTHPQGRKVNSEEQRKRNGASFYR